jgi:endogenous inhibitor of DNA gyrase (YacG/DUF329 family)
VTISGAKSRKVACPMCGKAAEYSPSNPWRPFCTERCKLIDLGEWASERYRIAVEEPDEGAPEDFQE